MNVGDEQLIRIDRSGVTAVLGVSARQAPVMHYWGPDLGIATEEALRALIEANALQHRVGDVDSAVPTSLLPVPAEGWTGTPGWEIHRNGRFSSHAIVPHTVEQTDSTVTVRCRDDQSAVETTFEVELRHSGLVRQRLTVVNVGSSTLDVQHMHATFPLPDHCREILDCSGRWMRERVPQRHPLTAGRYARDSRKGRSGADGPLLLVVGDPGFDFQNGEVRALHVAWSGNTSASVERTVHGGSVVVGGELLLPGEIILGAGESYSTPWVYAGWGNGLDDLASRFHAEVRGENPIPPAAPTILNVWEAVYFDHRFEVLGKLADLAAGLGVESYVLDDGWFLGRRDDRRALGDWFVDPEVWPDGLTPLVDHVRSLGMQFGLWVEPEMVSEDSLLARSHPEWLLRAGSRMPRAARWQQVLDLSNPEVFDYLYERLDWLLSQHDISFVKWDHNRDVIEPGDADGRARMHEHVRALYRLIDELRAKHPHVLIENCASGGSRIDLELLARTHRTWVSDSADPLERAQNQLYTGLLLPLEMSGNDLAAVPSHTTGRVSGLDLQGSVALLGWLGLQIDLLSADEQTLSDCAGWIALYKECRPLLHSGRVLTLSAPDPSLLARMVVAQDQSQALLTIVTLSSSFAASGGRLRIPGLIPEAIYDVRVVTPGVTAPRSMAYTQKAWVAEGATLTGHLLATIGLDLPVLNPEQGVVVRVSRLDEPR